MRSGLDVVTKVGTLLGTKKREGGNKLVVTHFQHILFRKSLFKIYLEVVIENCHIIIHNRLALTYKPNKSSHC